MLCQFQAAQEAQAKAEAEQNQNYLKRETPFLCNVRFRCDLPEVGMQLRRMTIAHSASDSPVTLVTSILHLTSPSMWQAGTESDMMLTFTK